jgi:hypothetical protein
LINDNFDDCGDGLDDSESNTKLLQFKTLLKGLLREDGIGSADQEKICDDLLLILADKVERTKNPELFNSAVRLQQLQKLEDAITKSDRDELKMLKSIAKKAHSNLFNVFSCQTPYEMINQGFKELASLLVVYKSKYGDF